MSDNKRRSSLSESTEQPESFKNDEKNVKAFVISSSEKSNLLDSQLIKTLDGSKKLVKIQDSPKSKTSRLVDFGVNGNELDVDENEMKSNLSLEKSPGSVIESMMVILNQKKISKLYIQNLRIIPMK